MTTARRTAFATTVLSLILAAASPGEGKAASDAPLRQLRAAIHDVFSPPRRARRPKAKRTPAAVAPAARSEVPGARQDRQAAGSRRQSGPPPAEAAPVPEPQPRPEAAKARAERVAKLPAAKQAAPARPPTSPAKLPAAKEAARAQPSTLPAKPRGRPARTAALPPPTEVPAKGAGAGASKPSSTADPAPPPGPSACQLRLTPELAAVQLLPSVSAGQCTVDDVVRLEAVMARDGRRVALNPPATLRCPMAEAVIHWVRDELAPAAAADLGSSLKALSVDTSFECRGRNRVAGAKLSEHGHANAIDLRAITLANGSAVTLTDMSVDKALRERLKQGACSRFTTVLGPGSDGYHESHIHLDLIERRGGYRMCQWDVRDVADVRPMPRARPPEAPPRAASTGQAGTRN